MAIESELRREALDYIKQKIAGCFGDQDGIFAGHPFDEERAKELRKFALSKNLALDDMKTAALTYMTVREYSQDHINEQMLEIGKFFGKKLS